MIRTKDIANFTEKIFSRSRGYREKKIMHSNREWFIIVTSFFLLFGLSLFVALYQYEKIINLNENITPDSGRIILPSYNQQVVSSLLQDRNKMKLYYKELLSTEIENRFKTKIESIQNEDLAPTDEEQFSFMDNERIERENTQHMQGQEILPEVNNVEEPDFLPVPVFD